MTAAALVETLHARGVTLIAEGETLRCRPKSALSAEDLKALKAMKTEVLAALVKGSPAKPITAVKCFACKGHRFWRSTYGVVICAKCHPPACAELVAEYIEPAS